MKRCSRCKEVKRNSQFNKEHPRKDKLSVYCKKCHNANSRAYYTKNPTARIKQTGTYRKSHLEMYRKATRKFRQKLTPKERAESYRKHNRSPNGKYRAYKFRAKVKRKTFSLTRDQFLTFWQQPCYYCGTGIETVGLDRIHNNKGYTIDNVVSCCKTCNFMKRSMSQKEFIAHCILVVERSTTVM